ncbi:9495_t:CDS:2 [Cetraspora pellucida]|uniref:9495_t:CDS:1 n=1 Tax=Cetraspora pellucida TaxID=1433469 RepID=A0A9N9FFX9_9GLOM|nr:9495_t:CDS:2 [Cetraspora pellucida]
MAKTDTDDFVYNGIMFEEPRIDINDIDIARLGITPDFLKVDTTIFYGTSGMRDEVEQLYNLIVDKKADIDRILESKPVYAIGPNFYKGYSFPFITCWATSQLEPSILERLMAIFDYEVRVVSQVIEPVDGNGAAKPSIAGGSERNNNNGDDFHSGKSDDRSTSYGRKDDGYSGGSGSRDDNNDKDGSSNYDSKVITINSVAKVTAKGQDHTQDLSVAFKFHAKFDNIQEKYPKFAVNVDISLKIKFIPIANEPDNHLPLILQGILFPDEKVGYIEHLKTVEEQVCLRFGNVPTAEVQVKRSNSTKAISNEWNLQVAGTCVDGYSWSYKYNSDLPKLKFEPGLHKVEGKIASERIFTKPKLIKCPSVTHTLKLTFNDLKDFNEKFSKLTKLNSHQDVVESITFTVNDINPTNNTAKMNSDIISIENSIKKEF